MHLLLFGLAILLPQLLLGSVVGSWYVDDERERLRQGAAATASGIRARLDRELDAMTASLEALATSPYIDSAEFELFQQQATTVLERRGTAIAMRDRRHQQVINTFVPWGSPLPVSTHPVLVRTDDRVFSTARPAVSDLYIGAVARSPFVLVDVPVIRNGEVRYALNMALSPSDLAALVFPQRLPVDWVATITDGNDVVVSRSQDHARFVGMEAPPEYRAREKGVNGSLSGVEALDGTPVFATYTSSLLSDWTVVVSVPETILAKPAQRLLVLLLAFAGLATAVSVGVAALVSRLVSRDIGLLEAQVAALGGPPPPERPSRSVREIATVSDALAEVDRELHARARGQEILLAELNHRVRNSLSIVQGLVRGTSRGGGDADEMVEAILGRVLVLGRAHALLSASGWAPVDLAEAVRAGAEGLATVRYDGPPLRLKSEAVVPLLQVLHEVAHLAERDDPEAPVEVAVTPDGAGGIRLVWRDRHARSAAPSADSYGNALMRRLVERQLGGQGSVEAGADGLVFLARLPGDVLDGRPPAGGATRPVAPSAAEFGTRSKVES